MNKDKIENQEELDFDSFMEEVEGQEDEKVRVIKLGNELVRFVSIVGFVDAKITMTYGDKLKVKSANKPKSIVFDEDTLSREILLKEEDTDLFILTEQIKDTDLGKLSREDIQNNKTHEKLFEAVLEVVKMKNGLTMTKKQLEKKGK